MTRLVEVLEPIGAHDVRKSSQSGERVAGARGALRLALDHWVNSVGITVPTAVLRRSEVEFGDQHRAAGQRVQRLELEARKRSVIPGRVEVAGGNIDITRRGPHDFRIIK